MNEAPTPHENDQDTVPQSRLQLVWDVMVFQLKLTVDGLRDVILVPVSLLAALVGLFVGGDHPAEYFERVLKFGRRTEHWINLFGRRRTTGTADEIIKPIQDRVFSEAGNRPWLRKAGTTLNRSIDSVGEAVKARQRPGDDET